MQPKGGKVVQTAEMPIGGSRHSILFHENLHLAFQKDSRVSSQVKNPFMYVFIGKPQIVHNSNDETKMRTGQLQHNIIWKW